MLGPVDGVTADQSKYWPGVPIIIITSPSIRTRSSLITLTLHSLSLCPPLRSGRGKNQRYDFELRTFNLSLLTLFKCLKDFTNGEGKHYMPHLIKIPVKKCWGRERECAETGNDAGAAAEGRPALLLPSLNTEMFHPPHLIHF